MKNDNLKQRSSNHCRKYLNRSCDISFNCYVAANVCCKDAFTHHLELAKKSKFKIWLAVNCGVSIAMIPPIQKSPRRGIEPRSPAWQAGILTTILSRMIYYSNKIFEKSILFPTENCIRTFKNTCSTSFLHNSLTCL